MGTAYRVENRYDTEGSFVLWGAAEQASTKFGIGEAQRMGLQPPRGLDTTLVGAGDLFRGILQMPIANRVASGYVGLITGAWAGVEQAQDADCGWAFLACAAWFAPASAVRGEWQGLTLEHAAVDPREEAATYNWTEKWYQLFSSIP